MRWITFQRSNYVRYTKLDQLVLYQAYNSHKRKTLVWVLKYIANDLQCVNIFIKNPELIIVTLYVVLLQNPFRNLYYGRNKICESLFFFFL